MGQKATCSVREIQGHSGSCIGLGLHSTFAWEGARSFKIFGRTLRTREVPRSHDS